MINVELRELTIRELTAGFVDSGYDGVVAYNGKLDVRPPYQREFIYDIEDQKAVIDTIYKGCPLGVMYWAKRSDGTYEIIDGQQRTLSICRYVANAFTYKVSEDKILLFYGMSDSEQKRMLDTKLNVYICDGSDDEKLAWFKRINIAGKALTKQELRNAVYYGKWVTDAKRYFSRLRQGADKLGKPYINTATDRQGTMELAIKWACKSNCDDDIKEYMALHHNDENAAPLWEYFKSVIAWIKSTFPTVRPVMKSIDWGMLYDKYKSEKLNAPELEKQIAELLQDDDVTSKSGVYYYVLDKDERHLSIRAFDNRTKIKIYEQQNGLCAKCGKHFEIADMEADHIKPFRDGGRTTIDNCQMLCRDCNRRKSDK